MSRTTFLYRSDRNLCQRSQNLCIYFRKEREVSPVFDGGLSEAISVLDEEVDNGGWETSLDDERASAFRRMKIGHHSRDSRRLRFLPQKRHRRIYDLLQRENCPILVSFFIGSAEKRNC